MSEYKILSGYELVARGITKQDGSLPEVGLKDVGSSGSWLEQKQIQSALEARKHLVEVERIEKSGTVSHAEWREDLKLAEVTQKAGGHWQFIGHNVGKQLFLNPEEALFLMEVNCLLLKHNGVNVSIQKGYSILLNTQTSLIQYKVYASLSRLGYKVYRHETPVKERQVNVTRIRSNKNEGEGDISKHKSNREDSMEEDKVAESNDTSEKQDGCETVDMETDVSSDCSKVISKTDTNKTDEELATKSSENPTVIPIDNKEPSTTNHRQDSRLHKLENRKQKSLSSTVIQNTFKNFPELFQKQVVTVNIPEEASIPKNVFLNNMSYVLNLEVIKSVTKNVRAAIDSRPYSASEEVNGDHVRRVENVARELPQTQFPFPQHRPYIWRAQNNINMSFIRLNFFGPRPFFPNLNFMPRMQFDPHFRPMPFFRQMPPLFRHNMQQTFNQNMINSGNSSNPLKRRQDKEEKRNKEKHYGSIKRLGQRLKRLMMSSNGFNSQLVVTLQKLIQSYNARYKAKLRLTDEFEINDDEVLETIELDCDEESSSKRARKDTDGYETNLNKLKELAFKLKQLETQDKATGRHRRALSGLMKRFNKSYKAEVHMKDDYAIQDSRCITLESSSDSDCVIEENKTPGKKLKNPFNILKRLAEKRSANDQSTSRASKNGDVMTDKDKYSDEMKIAFGDNWLPPETDFGRAEVTPKHAMCATLMESKRDEYLFEFMKEQPYEFYSWADIKRAFLRSMETIDAAVEFEDNSCEISSLIGTETSADMRCVLDKLSIIKSNQEIGESSLAVHFDVYNRNVQNFRKSNRPKPHFRVVCIDESSPFPSSTEVSSLYAKYEDDVPNVFAIVSTSSVSYLQVIPKELPVYIPNSDSMDLT